MRVLAVVIGVVLLCSGCVSYRASKITAITGAAALVTGVVIGATDSSNEETGEHAIDGREAAAGLLVLGGIVLAISGVIGMVAFGPPAPATDLRRS